ncbi:uncharacterized protein BCR38DRAFT_486969 [Pseudomassariella vexata]|uniref:Uncharacterized protein n=1 Tax=Pseudomassariella vexata TaxID=1141098 RepID=A0A1Y2DPK0_9PEZI|nr:uncharacterized protein BCR38DRAFT_486969 [Pseudomassariella vexata]ORY61208.1 hypothetical protein BCR38DRAFT_486969 [Pseudomassariella vexata]
MHKGLDMTWYTNEFQTGVVPSEVWCLVSWVAFVFKLASLAFAFPIIGLILFDFCLWIWRLNLPPPRDTPRSSVAARTPTADHGMHHAAEPGFINTTAMTVGGGATGEKRTGYSADTGN